MNAPSPRLRWAVLQDFREEGWHSMDLYAEQVVKNLGKSGLAAVEAVAAAVDYRPRTVRIPILGTTHVAHNVDRMLNRHWDYGRYVKRFARLEPSDVYHVVDHSYAHILLDLPSGRARTLVTCHDIDAFRCLVDAATDPRPWWFRGFAQRTLAGLRKADLVACVSESTRTAMLGASLVPASRLHVVPNGIDEAFGGARDLAAEHRLDSLLGTLCPDYRSCWPELVHVGATISRKRIDVLIEVAAAIQRLYPRMRLWKVGGRLQPGQVERARGLGVWESIVELPFMAASELAALYRRADLVLQTSDSEGFGLPVAEATACGTPVLASDIEVLREVGGEAASYCQVGDVEAWTAAALMLLKEGQSESKERRAERARRGSRWTWQAHVDRLVGLVTSGGGSV